MYWYQKVYKNWREILTRCGTWRYIYSKFPNYDTNKDCKGMLAVVLNSRSELREQCLQRFLHPPAWYKKRKMPADLILLPQSIAQYHGYRLCLACRLHYYIKHPELYPESSRHLMKMYALHFSAFDDIEYRTTDSGGWIYNGVATIVFARNLFSGDIGIALATAYVSKVTSYLQGRVNP
ncbi:hypothetical protein BG003_007562 [Podila horticola]|nr:hypothetical protein BG003_007562 [Podila horticola]